MQTILISSLDLERMSDSMEKKWGKVVGGGKAPLVYLDGFKLGDRMGRQFVMMETMSSERGAAFMSAQR